MQIDPPFRVYRDDEVDAAVERGEVVVKISKTLYHALNTEPDHRLREQLGGMNRAQKREWAKRSGLFKRRRPK